jgi:uncharacterized protein YkwD
MRAMSGERPRLARRGLVLAALFAAFIGLAAGPVAHPAPANAGTAETMESLIIGWINHARQNRGIAPLTVGPKLMDLAGDRAAYLAKTARLAHPDCLSCILRNRDISFHTCSEVVAMTSYPWGYNAAKSLFTAWKNSSLHWGILMSRSYTRIGIGVAYRSSNHTSWAAGVLAG